MRPFALLGSEVEFVAVVPHGCRPQFTMQSRNLVLVMGPYFRGGAIPILCLCVSKFLWWRLSLEGPMTGRYN